MQVNEGQKNQEKMTGMSILERNQKEIFELEYMYLRSFLE